ncbi:MAG: acetyl-CoA decarbonylase/synthase complex subunit delta, partial [Clostridia bacterium]|nr:acetyl-CoA decarbonylase/synthase complex subunit delta [Clostridia bacterium]
MELIKEKWIGKVNELTLGTGIKMIKVGGAETLPFADFEGELPHRPAIALEVWEQQPDGWPLLLAEVFGEVWADPIRLAKKCQDLGADFI